MPSRRTRLVALTALAAALVGARVFRRDGKINGRPHSGASRLNGVLFDMLNRLVPWHHLPLVPGLLNIKAYRDTLRKFNLYHSACPPKPVAPAPVSEPRFLYARTPDGSFNDLEAPEMGMAGTRFGRNVPLERTYPEAEPALLTPSPRTVSRRLLTRDTFIPATTLNILAAAWIQFQTHGWFSHGKVKEGRDTDFRIPLETDDDWPLRPMRIARTPADPTHATGCPCPPTYLNVVSHWWDGSAIYGSDASTMHQVQAHEDGKLLVPNGRLPVDPQTGIASTGFSDNWWVGLGLLHTLFALEHNAICDRLRREYRAWSNDRLFDTARLINCALMAKIHTVEWTPAIVAHPTVKVGMRANWWGLASERVSRLLGRLGESEALSGIPGSPTDHHGVPYALTEEFVAVYRMHPLIPDDIRLHSAATGKLLKQLTFRDVMGPRAELVVGDDVSIVDVLYSFGIEHPGAVTLHNYPRMLQNLETQDGRRIDLAAVDVLRDRERGVPRYNEFRRHCHLPAVRSFEDLTSNPTWARELREVYAGDIERVDLMVGMYAETPPHGFGFSDTAFRVFILMASRRLKSDRFFTTDYTPRVYTQTGLDWVSDNDMTSVLLRHYPELEPALHRIENAFAPWNRLGQVIR